MIRIASIIVTFVLFIVATITISMAWKQNTKTMKNVFVKKDLINHGITLVTSTDADFGTELNTFIKDNDEDVLSFIDAVKPFAVFVKNTSTKDIIGISLRWEIVNSDGSINNLPQMESSPGQLIDFKRRNPAKKVNFIPLNSSRFFALDKTVQQLVRSESQRKLNSSTLNGEELDELRKYLPKLRSEKQAIADKASKISVSIDGIFFGDGTFIGTDKNHFFAYMQATVDSRKDFVQEVREAIKAKKSIKEIFTRFESLASYNAPSIDELDSQERMYEGSYKAHLCIWAKQAIAKKVKLNESKVIEEIANTSFNNWFLPRREAEVKDVRE